MITKLDSNLVQIFILAFLVSMEMVTAGGSNEPMYCTQSGETAVHCCCVQPHLMKLFESMQQ